MSRYSEQLKDPRWQKKRLRIFERDKWKCTKCGSATKELHVHHKSYKRGCAPWEYPDKNLVTLCVDCHGKRHAKVEVDVIKTFTDHKTVLSGFAKLRAELLNIQERK